MLDRALQDLGVAPRTPGPIFFLKITSNFMIFSIVYLVCIKIRYQLPIFYPQGHVLGAPCDWTLKTNIHMLDFNNFLTTRWILDLNVSLDRVLQDLNVCLKTESPIFDKFDYYFYPIATKFDTQVGLVKNKSSLKMGYGSIGTL